VVVVAQLVERAGLLPVAHLVPDADRDIVAPRLLEHLDVMLRLRLRDGALRLTQPSYERRRLVGVGIEARRLQQPVRRTLIQAQAPGDGQDLAVGGLALAVLEVRQPVGTQAAVPRQLLLELAEAPGRVGDRLPEQLRERRVGRR